MRPILVAALVMLLSACAPAAPPTAAGDGPYLVFFQEWSAAIDDSAKATLATVARRAGSVPASRLVITAYADPFGSAEANADLTRLRARVISDTLVQMGVASGRIERKAAGAVGFAGSAQESRRAEIVIVTP